MNNSTKSGISNIRREIILDRDAMLILESTDGMSKSANQIILDSNIATSTAYRKLKKLVSMNILRVEYVIGEYGRWEMRYKKNTCLIDSENKPDCV